MCIASLEGGFMILFKVEQILSNFDRQAFKTSHSLVGHPLLSLERLQILANQLPKGSYESNSGHTPINAPDPSVTKQSVVPFLEAIRQLDQVSSWIAMKNIEQVPEYFALMNQLLMPLKDLGHFDLSYSSSFESFIFASSPTALTPYHMDPEQNFLMQVQGSKKVFVVSREDQEVVPPSEIEDFYYTGARNRKMPLAAFQKAEVFELIPGDVLYIPPSAPHWVEVTSAVPSVSMSVTFRTPATNKREKYYRANGHLRRQGFRPNPVGVSDSLDFVKYLSSQAIRRFRA